MHGLVDLCILGFMVFVILTTRFNLNIDILAMQETLVEIHKGFLMLEGVDIIRV
jgi:hypothetical protein